MSIKFIPEKLKDEAEELFTFFEEYNITANDEFDLESYFYTGKILIKMFSLTDRYNLVSTSIVEIMNMKIIMLASKGC